MTELGEVTARYRNGQSHLFPWTTGGPEDGSLCRQVTACGRVVEDPDAWKEEGGTVSCCSCLNTNVARQRRSNVSQNSSVSLQLRFS
jgi:hypothetical protein